MNDVLKPILAKLNKVFWNIKKDNKINLVVPVINRGEFNLKKVNSNIEIYNHQDELVTTLKTNEISISSKERGELVVELDSSNIASGPYKAIATTLYDGESLTNQKQFTVGLKELVVESIEVNDFTLGKMAEFEILVNNKWSQPITDVYVQMLIYDKDGSLLANLKSPSYNVDSLDKTLITTFWDTKDITKGTYDSEFLLIYEDNSDKKDLTLEVSRNEIKVIGLSFVISEVKPKFFETSNLIRILVILIVVLIIVNIIWFLFVRKKLTRRR